MMKQWMAVWVLLVAGMMASMAHARSPVEVGVSGIDFFGVGVGSTVSLPACEGTGGARKIEGDSLKELQALASQFAQTKTACVVRSDAQGEVNGEPVLRAFVFFPQGKAPEMSVYSSMVLNLDERDVVVQAYYPTEGRSNQQAVLNRLVALYGKPAYMEVGSSDTAGDLASGAVFADWQFDGYRVMFMGELRATKRGVVVMRLDSN